MIADQGIQHLNDQTSSLLNFVLCLQSLKVINLKHNINVHALFAKHNINVHALYSNEPGVVFARKQPNDEETRFELRKDGATPPPAALPPPTPPPGLDLQRQWYLHDRIREFCHPSCMDITCPKLTTDLPPRRAAAGGSTAQPTAASGSTAQPTAASGSTAQPAAASGSTAQPAAASGSAAQPAAASGSTAQACCCRW